MRRTVLALLLLASVAGSYYARTVYLGEYVAGARVIVIVKVLKNPRYRNDLYPVEVEKVLRGAVRRGQTMQVEATSSSPPGPALAEEERATRLLLLLSPAKDGKSYDTHVSFDFSRPDLKIYVDGLGSVLPGSVEKAVREYVRLGFTKKTTVAAWVGALRSRDTGVRGDVLNMSGYRSRYLPKQLRAVAHDARITRTLLAMTGRSAAAREAVGVRALLNYDPQATRLLAGHLLRLDEEDDAAGLIAYLRKEYVSVGAAVALALIDEHKGLAHRCLVRHRWTFDELIKRLDDRPDQARAALRYLTGKDRTVAGWRGWWKNRKTAEAQRRRG